MRVLLSSFSMGAELEAAHRSVQGAQSIRKALEEASHDLDSTRHPKRQPEDILHFSSHGSPFYRMPPVSMREISSAFVPDYAVLLLCEKVLMDETSYHTLLEASSPLYSVVRETIQLLQQLGFIQLVDYAGILERNDALLGMMLQNDLRSSATWLEALNESIAVWQDFVNRAMHILPNVPSPDKRFKEQYTAFAHDRMFIPTLKENVSRTNNRKKLRNSRRAKLIIEEYLKYVNANLVLSNLLGVGFHDWADFLPFYRQKFLAVGREPKFPKRAAAMNQLFNVSFPEYAISDTKTFMRVVTDKRVEDLRHLVQDAVDGKVTFDREFARSVFKEVLQTERQITRYRNIVSYLTMPLDLLGLVPGVGAAVQKGVEEVVGGVVEHKMKEKYRWFYLLSDVAEKAKTP